MRAPSVALATLGLSVIGCCVVYVGLARPVGTFGSPPTHTRHAPSSHKIEIRQASVEPKFGIAFRQLLQRVGWHLHLQSVQPERYWLSGRGLNYCIDLKGTVPSVFWFWRKLSAEGPTEFDCDWNRFRAAGVRHDNFCDIEAVSQRTIITSCCSVAEFGRIDAKKGQLNANRGPCVQHGRVGRPFSHCNRSSRLAGLSGGSLSRQRDLALAGLPEFISRSNQPISDESQKRSEGGDEPIWGVIQKCIVPLAFLASFMGMFICDVVWPRLVGFYVLVFGFSWVGLITWFGIL